MKGHKGLVRLQAYLLPAVWRGGLVFCAIFTIFLLMADLFIVVRKKGRNKKRRLAVDLKTRRRIIDNTGTAIFIADEDGTISFVNRGFEMFSGYHAKEVVGMKHWRDFIARDDLSNFTVDHLTNGGDGLQDTTKNEVRFVDRWGNVKSVHMVMTSMPEDGCILVSLIDISRRKDVEKELTKSREHIRQLSKQTELFSLAAASIISMKDEAEVFASISNAIIDHSDFNRVIISYFKDTSPYRDIIGYGGIDEAIIRQIGAVETPRKWYDDLFEKGIPVGQCSCYLPQLRLNVFNAPPTDSGPYAWAEEEGSDSWHVDDTLFVRMNDRQGYLIGVISVDGSKSGKQPTATSVRPLEIFSSLISQIIINKKNQEQTRKLERQLSHANKMESIGTLASGIAHDFNNLLTGILGNASLLNLKTSTTDPNYLFIKRIIDLVESGADLSRQILGFAREGKFEVKPTDLNAVLTNSADMFGRTRKEIHIIEDYASNLWTIDVDKGQIEQVLLNLFVNAAHAMPKGGKIYIKTENVVLDETFIKPYEVIPGRYVRFTVTDTGVGMDKKIMKRIFEPFFTTREMGRGTGLGLASAYGIIKSHDGCINVYSEPGQGTTFSIYLPFSGKGVDPVPNAETHLANGTETVLLIDDEDSIRLISKEMLDKLGYNVVEASGGLEGVSVYEERTADIDFVILDMIMPDMGGGETFDRLKSINRDVKVLLSSGYSLKGQAATIIERGCMGFIQKPFGIHELAVSIRKVLDETPVFKAG